jgi:hypothetical protein
LMLKEVAKLAYDFAEDFDIVPREDGYKEFCKLGIGLMGKQYGLNKFKTYAKSINEYFESYVMVIQDDNVEATLEFYSAWQTAMLEAGLGNQIYIDKDYKKYVHIVFARQEADERNANYEDWVQAQFAGLAFANAIPELTQYHGENAANRFEKYCRAAVDNSEETDEQKLSSSDEELDEYFKKLNG